MPRARARSRASVPPPEVESQVENNSMVSQDGFHVPDSSEDGSVPTIEHITMNYVPLQQLVVNLAHRSISELNSVLRTLPSAPSDAARKRQLLQIIVGIRQEFVKLFVLVRWARSVSSVSKAVDVSNWLRGQHTCYDNVVGALFNLQQTLGAAKMPWADLETALEVLKFGEPAAALPPLLEVQFTPSKPLGAHQILDVFHQLDVLLAVRLALSERLPPVYRGYSIANGRVRFEVPGVFWTELGIADGAIDARFFFIDMCVPETKAGLAPETRARLEIATNEQLTRKSLAAVLDWLHHYALIARLQALAAQARDLATGAWAGEISHVLTAKELVIRYWHGEHVAKISVGHRRLVVSPPDSTLSSNPSSPTAIADFLGAVARLRAVELIEPLSKQPGITITYTERGVCAEFDELLLTVDPTSGRFLLQNAPLGIGQFVDEMSAEPGRIVTIVENLRVYSRMRTLAARAEAAGWIALPALRLASGELSRISSTARTLLALRRPDWAVGWCVAAAISAPPLPPKWVATRISSTQRRWNLGPLHVVAVSAATNTDSSNEVCDYAFLAHLATTYSKRFALYELARALEAACIRHVLHEQSVEDAKSDAKVIIDLSSLFPPDEVKEWAYSALQGSVVAANTLEVEGRSLPGQLCELATSKSDECNVDGANDKFTVRVATTGGGKAAFARLLKALRRLHTASRAVSLANRLNLTVCRASLSEIELGYTPLRDKPGATLVVQYNESAGAELIFDERNPQHILQPFLAPLLARGGLLNVVVFLGHCYELFEVLSRFPSNVLVLPLSATSMAIFRDDFDHPDLSLDFGYHRGKPRVMINFSEAARQSLEVTKFFTAPQELGCIVLNSSIAIDVGLCTRVLPELLAALPLKK